MEIDGRGSQPASLNVMSSARHNAVKALLRALKESKLHNHTSDTLKEYLGPAMSFRLYLLPGFGLKCLLSSNFLRATDERDEHSPMASDAAEEEERRVVFTPISLRHSWAYQAIDMNKVLMRQMAGRLEEYSDLKLICSNDGSFQEALFVLVPLRHHGRNHGHKTLGALLVVLPASESDSEYQSSEIDSGKDGDALLTSPSSGNDERFACAPLFASLGEELLSVAGDQLESLISSITPALAPSMYHDSWGDAGGLIPDPRLVRSQRSLEPGEEFVQLPALAMDERSGFPLHSIPPGGVPTQQQRASLSSAVSGRSIRNRALEGTSEPRSVDARTAHAAHDRSVRDGHALSSELNDSDSFESEEGRTFLAPAHEEALNRFQQWYLAFPDREMEVCYRAWRSIHLSSRDSSVFSLLLLAYALSYVGEFVNSLLAIEWESSGGCHGELNGDRFEGCRSDEGDGGGVCSFAVPHAADTAETSTGLSLSTHLGHVFSWPKVISALSMCYLLFPTVVMTFLVLVSSPGKKWSKHFRRKRDRYIATAYTLLTLYELGIFLFGGGNSVILKESHLGLPEMGSRFHGDNSSVFKIFKSLVTLTPATIRYTCSAIIRKQGQIPPMISVPLLGIILQSPLQSFLLTCGMALGFQCFVDGIGVLFTPSFWGVYPLFIGTSYVLARWNRRRFLLSPVASSWIW